jgi:hypothetical protein
MLLVFTCNAVPADYTQLDRFLHVRRIYFVCALAALSLLGTIFAILMALGISGAGSFAASRSTPSADVCALMASDYGDSFAIRNVVFLPQFRQLSLAKKNSLVLFSLFADSSGPGVLLFLRLWA